MRYKRYRPHREYPKRGFTEEEAAAYVAMSRSFLRQDRMNGERDDRLQGPKWVRVGRRSIRYLREDLDAWLDAWKDAGSSEPDICGVNDFPPNKNSSMAVGGGSCHDDHQDFKPP